jgi:hypothetical protein
MDTTSAKIRTIGVLSVEGDVVSGLILTMPDKPPIILSPAQSALLEVFERRRGEDVLHQRICCALREEQNQEMAMTGVTKLVNAFQARLRALGIANWLRTDFGVYKWAPDLSVSKEKPRKK